MITVSSATPQMCSNMTDILGDNLSVVRMSHLLCVILHVETLQKKKTAPSSPEPCRGTENIPPSNIDPLLLFTACALSPRHPQLVSRLSITFRKPSSPLSQLTGCNLSDTLFKRKPGVFARKHTMCTAVFMHLLSH